jgi:hypothetical protein
MKNIKKMKLGSSLLLLGLLLSIAACGSCDDKSNKGNKSNEGSKSNKEEKKLLKFTITGAKIAKFIGRNKSESGKFTIEVTEGDDKTDEYKIKLDAPETFEDDNYTGKAEDVTRQVKLTAPADGATLKSLGVGDSLKKGDKKSIDFTFTAGTGVSGGSSQVDVSIVDKDGKVVGGPVKLQWNHV